MNDTLHRKIALAGPSIAGKTTLLHRLKQRTPPSQLRVEADETKRITHFDTIFPWGQLRVITASGAFASDAVIPTVLTDATVVVYVVSATTKVTEQRRIFDRYVAYAVQVGVHWKDVPWLFVFNKIDLSDQNPLLTYIPLHFHETIFRCVAVADQGLDELWQQLLTLITTHQQQKRSS